MTITNNVEPLFNNNSRDLYLGGLNPLLMNYQQKPEERQPIAGTGQSRYALQFSPMDSNQSIYQEKIPSASEPSKSDSSKDSRLENLKRVKPYAVGISAGLQAGSSAPVETPSLGEAAFGVGASALTGAASGFLYGGGIHGSVVGGLTGLAVGGAKAWFGVRNARRRNREMRRLQEKLDAQRAADIARNEKMLNFNTLMNVEEASDFRKQTELKNKWDIYQKVSANMMSLVKNDMNLRNILASKMNNRGA